MQATKFPQAASPHRGLHWFRSCTDERLQEKETSRWGKEKQHFHAVLRAAGPLLEPRHILAHYPNLTSSRSPCHWLRHPIIKFAKTLKKRKWVKAPHTTCYYILIRSPLSSARLFGLAGSECQRSNQKIKNKKKIWFASTALHLFLLQE